MKFAFGSNRKDYPFVERLKNGWRQSTNHKRRKFKYQYWPI